MSHGINNDDDVGPYTGLRTASVSAQFKLASIRRQRELLPIFRHRQTLLYIIETSPVLILIGHTGSGKSTQLTQYLYEEGWTSESKAIACTQPRRVAATSVATRVAEEIGCQVGEMVGYSIRFEDMTSEKTRIKYMTDGMLLRELLVDPLLSRYSVVMIDEAHERSIYTDILLCIMKKVIRKRKDLRLIISSATLQAEEFANYFGSDTKIVSIEGKMYPVDILYLSEPTEDYVEKTIQTIIDIHNEEPEGDILAFLTGRKEINTVVEAILDRSVPDNQARLLPLPLHAFLPQDQQNRIFDPAPEGTRKVVISTNIAEASVTIDGIVYVIDCGYVKLRAYDPASKIESLIVSPVSKAAAIQRAGRAGRTKPGKCFRLYDGQAAETILPDVSVPEIQRTNLAGPILQLKSLGIENIAKLDMIMPPPVELVANGLELLYSLGALDEYGKLTAGLGERMAELPLDPMLSKVLLTSSSLGCMGEVLTVAAMMSVENVFYLPEDDHTAAEMEHLKFTVDEGDHLTMYNVYQAFSIRGKRSSKWAHDKYLNYKALLRAASVRNQLARYLDKLGVKVPSSTSLSTVDAETIRKCLVSGYFANAAKMQPDGSFKLVGSEKVVWAHPSSVMFSRSAEWVIYSELMELGEKTYMIGITKIERDWLLESAPDYYQVRRGRA
ncbi:P-loop containing nucleoside triphosphate hydrolase protein [Lipomyces tetrasporus]|uniref:RNA helicase n=1 Tax=Lipomyces tetrasporus TaxID=54092 RepID=A0AAD7QQA5_9ASCO|nr:P-loop containing nucleoside triphosphate hydrolase protein [Lipomyces tetrasporus]KAJ8099316.1 P-loop containing nucleoside triphosphate hydrolase protein [Lipomyces tetrasporus]